MGRDFVDSGSELLKTVVGKCYTAFFGQSSEDFPLLSAVSGGLDDLVGHLDSTLCVDIGSGSLGVSGCGQDNICELGAFVSMSPDVDDKCVFGDVFDIDIVVAA